MERAADRPRRRRVAELLRESERPLGVAEVAERLGVHVNTARFHLDALVADGLVERSLEEPTGPGRPRTVYSPRPGMDRSGVRSYRLLAQILLSRLAAEGKGGAEAARQAGRDWGRYVAEPPPPHRTSSPREATARLTALLDDLGFAPEPVTRGGDVRGGDVPDAIRLRHCPFLELAEEYGSLVCPAHLGLMQGALEEMRAPLTATALEPFAEPDACLVHLAHTRAA
jgi:predicted ArsR family transcriptional regulator